ncbi:MAG TPA: XdhC/CoxI family protein, partial [Haliangiales bacterium]|nr:XdhC/CoxI family protein [Haliangiales bacterium]
MRAEILQLAADLARRGEPFVLAMVVRRESASSAQQGDMAVITADGGYHGWLGGNCTQPTVRREAKRALADGKPRLISLSPDPTAETRPGVSSLPMSCHSGGSVDIYLEPVLPAPRLLLFGASPAVRALASLGKAMGYAVDVVAPAADRAGLPPVDRVFADAGAPELRVRPTAPVYAVVATMGEDDEGSAAAAIDARPAYLGVVASRKRFAELRATLLGRGIPAEALDRIHNPAGLDIGARLPEEVALSILAEIVKLRRAVAPVVEERAEPEEIDPVCGMTLVAASARHRADHDGHT